MGSTDFRLDVVGIGALNLDYIASAPSGAPASSNDSLRRRITAIASTAAPSFQWGAETLVDERTVYAALDETSTASVDIVLGGSAWNAIFALSKVGSGLRLGYVGVAGRVRAPGISSLQQLELLGIDHTFVRRSERRDCGMCFSYVDGGERTLLTTTGANVELAELIDQEFENLAGYLAETRVVHITSLLDQETPWRLLALLQRVKQINRNTLVSFDPGHPWASNQTPAVEGILALSDFLLVNSNELAALAGDAGDEDEDEATVAHVLERLESPDAVVVVKRADGVTVGQRSDGSTVECLRLPQIPLPDDRIQDSTGAGDVFAAGVLAAVAGERLQLELGAALGMRLARHKLRHVGSAGHAAFPDIARELIRGHVAKGRSTRLPKGVFISHGGNPQWHEVRDFIERECGLPTCVFESHLWSSKQVTEALQGYLEQCSFAVCVLTAEDLAEDGTRRARQNVLHEAGLFQGRHGFERVTLLVEDCEVVPELAGLPAVRFPRGRVDTAFWQLQRMIRTQGFSA